MSSRAAARIGGGGSPRILRFAEEEAGAVEVDVSHVEFHGAALGDFPGLVQVALRALGAGAFAFETPQQPGAGEKAADEVVLNARAAEAVHGMLEGCAARIERRAFQNRRVEPGAAQGKVVKSDAEEVGEPFITIWSAVSARSETPCSVSS